MCIPGGCGDPVEDRRRGVRGREGGLRGTRQGQGEDHSGESERVGVFSAQTPEEEADKGLE